MSANAELIAEARALQAEAPSTIYGPHVAFTGEACRLLPKLADALEAAEAQVARLRAEALHQDDVSQVCGLCFASGLPDTQLAHSLGCPLVEEAR